MRNLLDRIFFICLLGLFPLSVFAQSNEQIIILWDVSGSLLPAKPERDLDGSKTSSWNDGNGLWVDLKKSVIDCIDYAESDPGNEITIVTFNEEIRDIYTRKATDSGKADLKRFVETYKYISHRYTNIVDPVKEFYTRIDSSKINYMFLFTDGEHDEPKTLPDFLPTIESWAANTIGRDAFGFYVLVHQDADKPNIRKSVESQDNFWIVPDARVRIKICTLPSSIKFNVRDEKGPKSISLSGRFAGAAGQVDLIASDEYYDVKCTHSDIKDGKIDVEVTPKNGVTPPVEHTIVLSPVIADADAYTFVGPKSIDLVVSNLPERSLNLSSDSRKWDNASYYKRFLWISECCTPARSKFKVDFSEQAKAEGSSARMMVYFIDKKDESRVSPSSLGLNLKINGIDTESIELTPDMSEVTIEVTGGADTKDALYYGRIQMEPSKLDNCSINYETAEFKWKFDFDQKLNPLANALIWLAVTLLSAIFLWMIALRPIIYPRFGSILKTFNVPGMAPLIVKFKGARMVVVSATPQKKQSGWNCLWTGKIIYKLHPAFITPMTFVPGRGKKILVRTQSGAYQISPNPMPGIGAAVITDVRKNLKINVN